TGTLNKPWPAGRTAAAYLEAAPLDRQLHAAPHLAPPRPRDALPKECAKPRIDRVSGSARDFARNNAGRSPRPAPALRPPARPKHGSALPRRFRAGFFRREAARAKVPCAAPPAAAAHGQRERGRPQTMLLQASVRDGAAPPAK